MGFFDQLAERFDLDDFDKRHKKAFIIISIAAILILVLWIIQLRKNIIYPLYGGINPASLQAQIASNQLGQVSADEAALRARDTDKDGLSDWDELNLYHTSPYLADSDSDSFPDKAEIDSGNDPNCPRGKNCFVGSDQSSQSPDQFNSNSLFEGYLNQSSTTTITPNATPQTQTGLTADEKNALRQTLGDKINDPKTIRQVLEQLGMDKTKLDSLSDQQIIDTLNALLK